jgi:hypothetical protein
MFFSADPVHSMNNSLYNISPDTKWLGTEYTYRHKSSRRLWDSWHLCLDSLEKKHKNSINGWPVVYRMLADWFNHKIG